MQIEQLPFIDEHATTVAAGVDDVWAALLDVIAGAFSRFGMVAYAHAVGCVDPGASGPRPLVVGSAIPGFRVTAAVPGSELVLEGRHRFSTYALIFRLEAVGPDESRLRAESRAEFPGAGGHVYRLLVVGSRGHVVAVRRMLRSVKRRTERS
jgi:hypothetical protein